MDAKNRPGQEQWPAPKFHVGPINSGEIVLVALGGMLAQSIVYQSVKSIRFRCHIRSNSISLDATLKCVPAGISIPEERVNDVSAIRLKDARNISLDGMRTVKPF